MSLGPVDAGEARIRRHDSRRRWGRLQAVSHRRQAVLAVWHYAAAAASLELSRLIWLGIYTRTVTWDADSLLGSLLASSRISPCSTSWKK